MTKGHLIPSTCRYISILCKHVVHYRCIHTFSLFRDKHLAEIDLAVNALKTIEESDTINFSKEESFLLVYQTKLQSDWLQKFGNTITCMDAVYKTLRYGFPCFFLVIKTSIGIGRVVGPIIPQFETEELIAEGLSVIKSWNRSWSPKYFMTDKSAQELG